VKKAVIGHGRKIGVILLNFLFGNQLAYFLFGALYRKTGVVFLLYPANQKYTSAYVYSWYARQMKWKPRLVGVLYQENRIGFIFGISATEKDFYDKKNTEKLRKLERDMEKIKRLLRAKQKSFAGVLPGVLASRGILSEIPERKVTVKAIKRAVERAREKENLPEESPVVILGGKGFIGSLAKKEIENSYAFDLGEEKDLLSFLQKMKGKPVIILNVTKKEVLTSYIPYFWQEITVVNEVYPEPTQKEVSEMRKRGVACYHMVGTRGKAIPSFPRAYRGGIPCCASFWHEGYEVILKKM